MCACCGLPFPYTLFSEICAACARQRPPFDRARSAVLYNDDSRRLIIAYKHADRMEIAGLFTRWLLAAGRDLLSRADVIVPVPLHSARLFHRRFNQAAVLASLVGRTTGIPVVVDMLERTKPSPKPGKGTREKRRHAVAGAFRIRNGHEDAIAGRRILVIDDVMTTGATARAVAGRLCRGRAATVDVLTIARVVREGTVMS